MKSPNDKRKPDPIPHERTRYSFRRDDFHVQAHYPGDAGKEKDFLREKDDGSERSSEDSQ